MYYIIGMLQGHAVGIESISHPNMEALAQSLHTCAESLEMIAKELSKECNNVRTEPPVSSECERLSEDCQHDDALHQQERFGF